MDFPTIMDAICSTEIKKNWGCGLGSVHARASEPRYGSSSNLRKPVVKGLCGQVIVSEETQIFSQLSLGRDLIGPGQGQALQWILY